MSPPGLDFSWRMEEGATSQEILAAYIEVRKGRETDSVLEPPEKNIGSPAGTLILAH